MVTSLQNITETLYGNTPCYKKIENPKCFVLSTQVIICCLCYVANINRGLFAIYIENLKRIGRKNCRDIAFCAWLAGSKSRFPVRKNSLFICLLYSAHYKPF